MTSPRLLYIHGFGSCGKGNKITVLRDFFGDENVLAPDLELSPNSAIAQLRTLIASEQPDVLIGSSLGGFYAEVLETAQHVPAVLINPSTRPYDTLARYLGNNRHWCSGQTFQWKWQHLDELRDMSTDKPRSPSRYLVLLQTGDEVLDYRLAAARYAQFEVVIERGGNHRFENLGDYLPRIQAFAENGG